MNNTCGFMSPLALGLACQHYEYQQAQSDATSQTAAAIILAVNTESYSTDSRFNTKHKRW